MIGTLGTTIGAGMKLRLSTLLIPLGMFARFLASRRQASARRPDQLAGSLTMWTLFLSVLVLTLLRDLLRLVIDSLVLVTSTAHLSSSWRPSCRHWICLHQCTPGGTVVRIDIPLAELPTPLVGLQSPRSV